MKTEGIALHRLRHLLSDDSLRNSLKVRVNAALSTHGMQVGKARGISDASLLLDVFAQQCAGEDDVSWFWEIAMRDYSLGVVELIKMSE